MFCIKTVLIINLLLVTSGRTPFNLQQNAYIDTTWILFVILYFVGFSSIVVWYVICL